MAHVRKRLAVQPQDLSGPQVFHQGGQFWGGGGGGGRVGDSVVYLGVTGGGG